MTYVIYCANKEVETNLTREWGGAEVRWGGSNEGGGGV